MAKYIDAETLIDELKSAGAICGFGEFLIERQPAADVRKEIRKHGRVERVTDEMESGLRKDGK